MNIKAGTSSVRSSGREMLAVATFVVVSLIAPLIVGELYPFTISPMFCDQPGQYCTYELYDGSGNELDLETFGLHLVYDGNPPGLGMGIEAADRLHEFGMVPDIETVVEHVRSRASELNIRIDEMRVRQIVVCCNGTCPEKEVREQVILTGDNEGQATN